MSLRYSSHHPPPEGMLSTPEVARLCGISDRQLDWMVRRGMVSPSVDAEGSGSRRLWSLQDLVKVARMQALWEAAKMLAKMSGRQDALEFDRGVKGRTGG